MEKIRITPVLLITGYLGSGKTTLLNRILNNRRGIRFAVIVNDIGEVNIDADLIAKDGIVNSSDDSLVPLQNGCICCTLQTDLVNQLCELKRSGKFDYIVIEASGICEPEPIAQTVCNIDRLAPEEEKYGSLRLDCIVTVVDALRMKDEFENGNALKNKNLEDDDIENLIIQQIEFCNIILLNKKSEVTEKELDQTECIIRAIQPEAEIFACDYTDVDLHKLLDTHLFDFEKVATSATWIREIEKPVNNQNDEAILENEEEHKHDSDSHHHDLPHGHHHDHHHHGEGEALEYGISTFVYFARRPFSLNKFDYFCAHQWPHGVIRTKGICYFKENPDMSYLFEQAGSRKQLIQAGKWFATAPEDELQVLLAREPGLMNDWDEEYGDRMQKLVFIGKNMDRESIVKQLDNILVK